MKGVIFRAFFSHVEEMHGEEFLEELIEDAQLENGGAYTAVGTYDADELVTLVVGLSEKTGAGAPKILRGFGFALFNLLAQTYPGLIEHCKDSFALISAIDNFIHVEVKKLYPDADLPRFKILQKGTDRLTVQYESTRGFSDLAEGLFEGCFQFFGEDVETTSHDVSQGEKTSVTFSFKRRRPASG